MFRDWMWKATEWQVQSSNGNEVCNEDDFKKYF